MQSEDRADFFVSTTGDDRWSGRLPEANARADDGPFASLDRARQALRNRSDWGKPTRVCIRGGTYILSAPLTFAPEDSGSPLAPISYEAYPGELPVLSGGARIAGWREERVDGRRAWVAKAPPWEFREIWVNGSRRYRPRMPRVGFFKVRSAPPAPDFYHGSNEFVAELDDLRLWQNRQELEIVMLTAWCESRLPIASVDDKTGLVRTKLRSALSIGAGARYFVENVAEALEAPGQWRVDRLSGQITYLPEPGETPEESVVVAPRLESLLILAGDPDSGRAIGDVSFRGLCFSHTEWRRSAATRIMRWNIISFSPEDVRKRRIEVRLEADDKAADHQAAVSVPGAIECTGAQRCLFERCSVEHVGTYAIGFGRGCMDNDVSCCAFSDLGAGGVKLGTGLVEDAVASGYNRVTDCEIRDGGKVFFSAVGIWIGQSGNNTIAHNHIHDLLYTGISVGWTWGYTASAAENNLIEHNDIHDIGKGILSDMGGIYTLGHSPGTIVRYNRIREVESGEYGACGIYLDEGSGNIVCECNIAYHIKGPALNRHYGRENTVRNNIFALSTYEVAPGRGEGLTGLTVERNIIYHGGADPLSLSKEPPSYRFRGNLYWSATARAMLFGGLTWEQWRAKGFDRVSMVADPGFADPERGDFTLPADSPALEVGFVPFDMSRVGPRHPCGASAHATRR
jgi:hypothetical protein